MDSILIFGVNVDPKTTDNLHNVIKVTNIKEIFYDVYECTFNGKKIIVEKVKEYSGLPIVNFEIKTENDVYNCEAVLIQDKTCDLFLNEDTLKFVKKVKKPTIGEVINEKIINEPTVKQTQPLYENHIKKISDKIINESEEKAKLISDNKIKEYNQKKQEINQRAEQFLSEKAQNIKDDLNEQYIDFLSVNDNKVKKLIESKVEDINDVIDENINNTLIKINESSNSNKKDFLEILSENINKIDNNIKDKIGELNDSIEIFRNDSNNKIKRLDEKNINLLKENTKEIQKTINFKVKSISGKIENFKTDTLKTVVEKVAENKTEIEKSLKNTILEINENLDLKSSEAKQILSDELANINEKLNIFSQDEDKKYKQLLENLNNLNKGEVKEILSEKISNSQINSLKLDIKQQFQNEMMSIKRLIELSSGGGSVAKQFAIGGTMDGDLKVTGEIIADTIIATTLLSAGTMDINFELSGFSVTGDVSANGNLYVTENINLSGDLFVDGLVDGRDIAADGAAIDNLELDVTFLSGAIDNTDLQQVTDVGFTTTNSIQVVNLSATGKIVGGSATNKATGNDSSVVGGKTNSASGDSTSVVGGEDNTAIGKRAFIGGGNNNTASANNTSVVGGEDNTASGLRSFIGGGMVNIASNVDSTVVGGEGNVVSGDRSFIGGGRCNVASNIDSTVVGGLSGIASGNRSFIGGGNNNTACGNRSFIGGGKCNVASNVDSTVVGGEENVASGNRSFIGGGRCNVTSGVGTGILGGDSNVVTHNNSYIIGSDITSSAACTTFVNNLTSQGTICGTELYENGNRVCTTAEADTLQSVTDRGFTTTNSIQVANLSATKITGGINNTNTGSNSFIGGGANNSSLGSYSTIGGGADNNTLSSYSTIGGGAFNKIDGSYSTIGGGANNTINALRSGIVGGTDNTITHQNSFIIGSNLTSNAISTTFVNNLSSQGYIHAGGDVKLSDFTSTSRSIGASNLDPIQNNQPASDDTVANLSVDSSGNVIRGSQEATWTFDRTQLNALTSTRVNLLDSPGAGKCVVVEETNWLIEVDLTKAYQATNVTLKCEMLGVNENSVATQITAANINQIAQILKTANTNSFGLYHRDVPDLVRIYRFDVPMTIRATNGAGAVNVFPDNFVSIKLKIKYRVFDKDTF